MSRYKATGQVVETANGHSARVRVGKERPSFALAVKGEAEAHRRAAVLASMGKRLRGRASLDEIAILLKRAGDARTETGLAEVEKAVEAIASGKAPTAASALAPTFEDFAKTWTNGELHTKHPDHVGEKDSTEDARVCRMYLNPVIGPTHVPDVTLEDAERVMSRLPSDLAPRTRKKIAQCMRKVLSLAVYPGRYIASNPIPREWMPKIPKSANKAKSYLRPSEDAKLLSCKRVDLLHRLTYGLLAREGMRASELERLKWSDVDLEHGRVRLDENKTDDPRAPSFGPEVTIGLKAWKHTYRAGAKDEDLFFTRPDGSRIPIDGLADFYREEFLRGANITRPELFERSKRRIPIRVHDLRGFFVTYALAHGKTETWVMDRTGHKSSIMVNRYRRVARTVAEARLGEPLPLHAVVPELAAVFAAANAAAKLGRPAKKQRTSKRHVTRNGPIAQSVELRTFNP
jgi:integrase